MNDSCWPNRNLAGGGELAFHAPYPELDATLPPEKLSAALAVGVSAVMSLVDINNNGRFRGRQRFPSELTNYTLSHLGSDFYTVTSIKQALMLDINLFGSWLNYRRSNASPASLIYNACENFYYRQRSDLLLDDSLVLNDSDDWAGLVVESEWFTAINRGLGGSPLDKWNVCFFPIRSWDGTTNHYLAEKDYLLLEYSPGLLSGLNSSGEYSDFDWGGKDITIEEAWSLIEPTLSPSEHWLFWKSDTILSDIHMNW